MVSRALREMAAATGGSTAVEGSASGAAPAQIAAPADLGEATDNLRAETAAAWAVCQQVKQKKQQSSLQN